MRIAVMGPGNIGSTLGRIWAGAGHDVTFTYSRDPGSLEAKAAEAGARAVPDAAAAVAEAEVVLLSVPSDVAEQALAGLPLEGKVVIDATNYLGNGSRSGAERVAGWAPGARVVKAVNSVFAGMFAQAAANPGRASMLIAGDDAEAKEAVSGLARDLGFEAVDAGGLEAARGLEAFAELNIGIAYRLGRGPFAYRLAEAKDL